MVEVSLQSSLIHVCWFRHTSQALFREVLEKALRFARAEGITLWLHDWRRLCYVTIADQSWLAREYYALFDPGLHHRAACVVSPQNVDLIPEELIQEFIRNNTALEEKVELKVFLNWELAEFWLYERFQPLP